VPAVTGAGTSTKPANEVGDLPGRGGGIRRGGDDFGGLVGVEPTGVVGAGWGVGEGVGGVMPPDPGEENRWRPDNHKQCDNQQSEDQNKGAPEGFHQ